MNKTYNLLDEAWMPCVDMDKHPCKVSLKDAVQQAHTIRSLEAELPPITSALHLLLIAFVLNLYHPKDNDDWERLYRQGHFSEDNLERYCQQWQERFYLFDERYPFYQDARLGTRDKDIRNMGKGKGPVEKGLTGLLLHISSGSNATLFDHTMDTDERAFLPDEAARNLVMIQAYGLAGMGSASIGNDKFYKDAAFSRGILFLCDGDTLFETLMKNIVPKSLDFIQKGEEDLPCWERDDAFAEGRNSPAGIRDWLTWQSRRLLLIPGQQNFLVRNCFSAPGLSVPETAANPFYQNEHKLEKEKLEIKPMRFQTNRVIWRDSGAILDSQRPRTDKPITRSLFENLRADGILRDRLIRLKLFGMCTEPGQKKVYAYQEESFSAPAIYVNNQELQLELKEALRLAEAFRTALYFATYQLASYKIYPEQDTQESMKPDKKVVGELFVHISRENLFWSQLETPFYQLLSSLPQDGQAKGNWVQTLKTTSQHCLAMSADLAGDDAAGLKARAKAENRLENEIYALFNPKAKEA